MNDDKEEGLPKMFLALSALENIQLIVFSDIFNVLMNC